MNTIVFFYLKITLILLKIIRYHKLTTVVEVKYHYQIDFETH